jgi:DNA polymerase I-like protein with 3'-5' exonuclease and polymerase domains
MALGLLAIDTETTGVGWHDEAFMISIAWHEKSVVFDKRQVSDAEWYDIISDTEQYLHDADKIIMHNAKFDIQKLCRAGISLSLFVEKFEDTQAMAHLYNEQESTSLKHLARLYLNEETDEDEVLRTWRRKNKVKKEEGYEPIPHDILAPYAQKDAEFTLRLYRYFEKRLPEDLYPLYQIEKNLTIALLGIEARGMIVDREYVTQKRKEYGDRIYKLKRRIGELAGDAFNPQSPQQILHTLAERGVDVGKTDKATLSALDDELARLIVELREANKIKATYFDALHEEARDGVLHPNFRQHGTRTGRMSSGSAEA